jgi:HK97 family phage prohead protease
MEAGTMFVRELNVDKREFTGIAVPWGQTVTIAGLWREKFDPNAVVDSENAKVFWRHDEVIGRIVSSRNTADGWEVTGVISQTRQGDDAMTLLQDGAVDGLSINFRPIAQREEPDGTVVFTEVNVREVSVTPFPQYDLARVSTLREEQRQPTQQEEPTMTDALTREELDTALQEREDELNRSLDVRFTTFGMAYQREKPADLKWRSPGEFLKALSREEDDAIEFQRQFTDTTEAGEEFRRAYTGGTTADDSALPSTWIKDAIRLIALPRKVINTFQREPLPEEGNTLEYGVLDASTVAVGKQAAEGSDLSKGKVTVKSSTATVETYGGWSELTIQQITRSRVDFLNLTYKAQALAYARDTETAARTKLIALIAAAIAAGNKVDVPHAPALFDFMDGLVDTADLFEARGYTLDGAYVDKATFKSLYRLVDGSNRMVFNVWGDGQNLAGSIDIKGVRGNLVNVPVKVLTGAAANTFVPYNELAFTTWESAGAPLQLQDQNIVNLSRQFSVYGFDAFGSQFPDAMTPFKFAAS